MRETVTLDLVTAEVCGQVKICNEASKKDLPESEPQPKKKVKHATSR